jgi:hypothetical protein
MEIIPLDNTETMYFPPTHFDYWLAEYVFSSGLGDMATALAHVVVEGLPETAIYTLGQFSLTVFNSLNITSEYGQTIIYTSIVRLIFDQAYLIRPELHECKRADAIFLERCGHFAKKTVRELQLSDSIAKMFTPGLQVSSLFKSKQVDLLKKMELLTNPIDLMSHVHSILLSLAQYFGTEELFLMFDVTLTLLLALTSIGPPANSISIAKFLMRWAGVLLSDIVSVAKNYFIAAVEQLLSAEEMALQ